VHTVAGMVERHGRCIQIQRASAIELDAASADAGIGRPACNRQVSKYDTRVAADRQHAARSLAAIDRDQRLRGVGMATVQWQTVRKLIAGDAVGFALQGQRLAIAGDGEVLRGVGMLPGDAYRRRAGVGDVKRLLNRIVCTGTIAGGVADINDGSLWRANGGGFAGKQAKYGYKPGVTQVSVHDSSWGATVRPTATVWTTAV